jgi:hypothetical protein
MFPAEVTCGTNVGPPSTYSSIPIFKIDEAAMTATLISHWIVPVAQYSFGGTSNHKGRRRQLTHLTGSASQSERETE